jgi:hypothetical protein
MRAAASEIVISLRHKTALQNIFETPVDTENSI